METQEQKQKRAIAELAASGEAPRSLNVKALGQIAVEAMNEARDMGFAFEKAFRLGQESANAEVRRTQASLEEIRLRAIETAARARAQLLKALASPNEVEHISITAQVAADLARVSEIPEGWIAGDFVHRQRLEDVKVERDALKRDYLGACETIALMHGHAVGKFGDGPREGVVEDVAALRRSRDALASACEMVLKALREGRGCEGLGGKMVAALCEGSTPTTDGEVLAAIAAAKVQS